MKYIVLIALTLLAIGCASKPECPAEPKKYTPPYKHTQIAGK
jgi:hypothetical protein